jgi:hypothetical protein
MPRALYCNQYKQTIYFTSTFGSASTDDSSNPYLSSMPLGYTGSWTVDAFRMPASSNATIALHIIAETKYRPTTDTASCTEINSKLENISTPYVMCRIVSVEVHHERNRNKYDSLIQMRVVGLCSEHGVNSSWSQAASLDLMVAGAWFSVRDRTLTLSLRLILPNSWITRTKTVHIRVR